MNCCLFWLKNSYQSSSISYSTLPIMNFIIAEDEPDIELETEISDIHAWFKDIKLYYHYDKSPKSILKIKEKVNYTPVVPNPEYRALGKNKDGCRDKEDLVLILKAIQPRGTQCPKCKKDKSYISLQIQKRAGDEGASVKYECLDRNCGYSDFLE